MSIKEIICFCSNRILRVDTNETQNKLVIYAFRFLFIIKPLKKNLCLCNCESFVLNSTVKQKYRRLIKSSVLCKGRKYYLRTSTYCSWLISFMVIIEQSYDICIHYYPLKDINENQLVEIYSSFLTLIV